MDGWDGGGGGGGDSRRCSTMCPKEARTRLLLAPMTSRPPLLLPASHYTRPLILPTTLLPPPSPPLPPAGYFHLRHFSPGNPVFLGSTFSLSHLNTVPDATCTQSKLSPAKTTILVVSLRRRRPVRKYVRPHTYTYTIDVYILSRRRRIFSIPKVQGSISFLFLFFFAFTHRPRKKQ